MKHHHWVALRKAVIAAGVIVALPAMTLAQTLEAGPGVVMSVSSSAAISTKGMPAGNEIWAVWYSLPAGKAVAESATVAKWAYVETVFGGSAVVSGDPTPMCHSLSAGGLQAPRSERVTEAGDVEVCNYANLPASRTENRGSQPYVFAGVAIGGPWKEDMEDDVDLYLKVNGLARTAHVTSAQFREVEKEVLDAGAMTVVIRNVTIQPGARIVTTDRYPTVRMVTDGRLLLTSTPKGSGAAAQKTLAPLEMLEWAPSKAEDQVVLSSRDDKPVQFIEWIVAPVSGIKP